MKRSYLLAAVLWVCAAPFALATDVDLDIAAVLNGGAAVFGDSFDNNNFDTPPWVVATGAPGSESGTTLRMRGGDTILAGVGINREFSADAIAVMDLVDFGVGSYTSLLFLGQAPNDVLALTFAAPGLGIFSDETGPLAFVPVPDAPRVTLNIHWEPSGIVTAAINETQVFNGLNNFSATSGIGISVVPEPASALMLVAGSVILMVRRKR